MSKEVKENSIDSIVSSIELLNLSELDEKIYRFFKDNFNYFMKYPKTSVKKENEILLVSEDESVFKVSLQPSLVAPTSVYLELINMNSNFIQN